MDDWQFIPLLEKTSQGQLTFNDLWAPHDEHRLLVPRIVIIAAMFAFNGDYRMQCCISFLAVEVISLCFLWLLIRLNGECFGVWATWLLANIALFSPIQSTTGFGQCSLHIFSVHISRHLHLCVVLADRARMEVRTGGSIRPGWKLQLCSREFDLAGRSSGDPICAGFGKGNPEAVCRLLDCFGSARRGIVTPGSRSHNGAAPADAYGHEGVPPTFSTLEQLRTHTGSTLIQMGLFVAGMFGNAIGGVSGFRQSDPGSSRRGDGHVACRGCLVFSLEARCPPRECAALGLSADLLLSDSGVRLCRTCLAR